MGIEEMGGSTAHNSTHDLESGNAGGESAACFEIESHSEGQHSRQASTAKDVPVTETQEKGADPTDPNEVDWDGPDDPENPLNWTPKRRWFYIGLVSAITFNVSMAATIFAPGVPQTMVDFHTDNSALSSLLVSIYLVGLAIGPLFLSPLTELYGRVIVTHVANVVFLVASILCAVSVNMPMLIVFRLIMGFACAVPLTVGGGYISDLVVPEKRGFALTMWVIGPLLGPVVGPVAGGYLSLKVGWRWTFWLVAILAGIFTIASAALRESYAPRLLQWKTIRLRKSTGNPHLRSKYDKGQTPGQAFRLALIRPAKLLFLSPIVAMLSLFLSVTYAYMYLMFTTFTEVFEETYGFNSGEAGLAYLGLGVGFIIGQIAAGKQLAYELKRQKAKNGKIRPEDRLPPLVVGTILLPIGLFWYGWTAQYKTHWIIPIVGTGFCGVGIMYFFLPIQMYLIDAFTLYAASALGSAATARAIFGTVIPLAGPAMYQRLGLGWGNSLLGFLGLTFIPVSVYLAKYGEKIRLDPRFQVKL